MLKQAKQAVVVVVAVKVVVGPLHQGEAFVAMVLVVRGECHYKKEDKMDREGKSKW